MGWSVKRLILCLIGICAAVLLCVGGFAAYWFPRMDCLCYKARFHSGEHFPIDAQIISARGENTPADIISIGTLQCKHGETVWAVINGAEYYTIKEFK